MACCIILVLFVTVTAVTSDLQSDEVERLQDALEKLLANPKRNQHVRFARGLEKHSDNHRTDIQFNLVFKNNEIVPLKSIVNPIAREEDESDELLPFSDILCKLGTSCGCRGLSGSLCNHDQLKDNRTLLGLNDITVLLTPNLEDNNVKNLYSFKNGYNNENQEEKSVDPIDTFLDNLENNLVFESNVNQLKDFELHCNGDGCANLDKDGRTGAYNNMIKSWVDILTGTEKMTNAKENDGSFDESNAYSRCCENCRTKLYIRTPYQDPSSEEDSGQNGCNKCKVNTKKTCNKSNYKDEKRDCEKECKKCRRYDNEADNIQNIYDADVSRCYGRCEKHHWRSNIRSKSGGVTRFLKKLNPWSKNE